MPLPLPEPSPAIGRRALLSLGTAVLISGCAPGGSHADAGQPSGSPSGSPAPSRSPVPSSPGGTTTPVPDPDPGTPSPSGTTPGPGCPTSPDVIPKPGTLQYLPCHERDIALTIDDGPHPVWTPQVLALLARLDLRATFCMIGQNVAAHPDLVRQVLDGGHQIANHTYTHPMNLATMSPAQVDRQLQRTTEVVTRAGGAAPTLFRAPGGAWSHTILTSASAAGMRALDWSVDTRDWSRPGVAHIVDVLLTKTHPGSIILDHDGGGDRSQTVTALTAALPRLIDQGYRFVLP